MKCPTSARRCRAASHAEAGSLNRRSGCSEGPGLPARSASSPMLSSPAYCAVGSSLRMASKNTLSNGSIPRPAERVARRGAVHAAGGHWSQAVAIRRTRRPRSARLSRRSSRRRQLRSAGAAPGLGGQLERPSHLESKPDRVLRPPCADPLRTPRNAACASEPGHPAFGLQRRVVRVSDEPTEEEIEACVAYLLDEIEPPLLYESA